MLRSEFGLFLSVICCGLLPALFRAGLIGRGQYSPGGGDWNVVEGYGSGSSGVHSVGIFGLRSCKILSYNN